MIRPKTFDLLLVNRTYSPDVEGGIGSKSQRVHKPK